jgi:DNA mismatch repair protein MLH3
LFEVSLKEGALFRQHQQFFKAWGIVYLMQDQSGSNSNGCLLQVTALPPSIAERCRTEPRLLIELLRKEIWRLNDEGRAPGSFNPTAPSDRSLTSRFRRCPRGILGLLHSRSCRSMTQWPNDPSIPHKLLTDE